MGWATGQELRQVRRGSAECSGLSGKGLCLGSPRSRPGDSSVLEIREVPQDQCLWEEEEEAGSGGGGSGIRRRKKVSCAAGPWGVQLEPKVSGMSPVGGHATGRVWPGLSLGLTVLLVAGR